MQDRCYGCMKPKTEYAVCPHCGWEETAENGPHQLPMGTLLNGQYRIGKVLGQGGFGITYLGWDEFLETPVAVKEYYPGSTVMRECAYSLDVSCGGGEQAARFEKNKDRFLREAKAIARLQDEPEIVKVSNFFQENNTAYLVMEYVDGQELKHYVKDKGGKLSVEETFELFRPILKALGKVHEAGLVHRDISPDNIMLLPGGGVKLIDFGAVRDVQNPGAETPLTKSTEAILKQGYAPIEQYQKRGALGPWTDVYALCATMYYCITGQVPMDAPERVLGDEEFTWHRIPGLTQQQADALDKGMALLPKDRLKNTLALEAALFGAEETAEEQEPLPVPPPQPKPEPEDFLSHDPKPKKKWWLLAIPVILVAAVLIFAQPKKTAEAPPPETTTATQPQTTAAVTEPEELAAAWVPETEETAPAEDDRWKENVLKKDNVGTGQTPVYGSRVRKAQIVSVTFYDSLSKASSSSWDVSQEKDGSVLAWVSGNGQEYDLYLAAEGGINGCLAAQSMFQDYTNLKLVRFNGHFHTDQAESLHNFFAGCKALVNLDVSSLNTAAVKDFSGMFQGCVALEKLDLRCFDTGKAQTMGKMFSGCKALTQLDVSSFDTSGVADMSEMFYNCPGELSVDISNFDFSAVRAYGRFMDEGRTINGEPWQKRFE